MTKTYTAKQLNDRPAPVFASAFKGEKTIITHNNYDGIGVRFVLVAEDKEKKDAE
jgi:hypothetical protein